MVSLTYAVHVTRRLIVAHIHLFKNAGTSIEASLREAFGEHWASHDGTSSAQRLSQHDLELFLDDHPSTQAVSSHQLRPPLSETDTYRYLPIVLLRHPIDRLRSAYEFERNQGPVSPSAKAAASADLAGWIDFHAGRGSHQCANFQTLSLTAIRNNVNGAPLMRRPIEEHVASATEFLESLGAVGIVERFVDSMDALQQWLRQEIEGFTWTGQSLNTGASTSSTLADRLDAVAAELGSSKYEELLAANQADLALHTTYIDRLGT